MTKITDKSIIERLKQLAEKSKNNSNIQYYGNKTRKIRKQTITLRQDGEESQRVLTVGVCQT